jgi:hypothetical protein
MDTIVICKTLNFFLRFQKLTIKLKQFNNTELLYQGSYELDFLNKYYDRFKTEIVRGPSIKYSFNNLDKVYHPDFYIPSLNLIVECKNSWLAQRDEEQIKCKKQATEYHGYNYIMIIDKNYTAFDYLLKL